MKKSKKILILTICILFILLIIIGLLYFFNKKILYSIYDGINYIKYGIEINLSDEYNKNIDQSKHYYKNEKNLRIPILLYHRIVAEEPTRNMAYMDTTYKNFEKQIAGLLEYGYTVISYDDLIAYYNGEKALPEKVVMIDFDDGFSGVYDYAFKIAKKYNIPMTTFLVDDLVGTPGYYTWDEAKEMSDSGLIHIYSHGKTHTEYNEVPSEILVQDIQYAHENIEKNLEKKVNKVFTYPYGLYTQEGIESLKKAGFVQNLTNNEINDSDTLNMYGLSRIYVLNHYSKYKILKMIK